ncbi:MAG: alpha/beta fold hydrolase [Candidatus Eisenbacteria bacterium]
MTVRGGRLDFLAPHLLRSQFLRPGFVRLSLALGMAQQMPGWAKLQFTNAGVSPEDLERVLRRISSLGAWADEWESLGRAHEQGARDALVLAKPREAARRYLAASAAYNFAQYVIFMNVDRKQSLHDSCVRAYGAAAPLFDPPALPFEVMYRRRPMKGYLRLPRVRGTAPVCVLFHGTNAVKEELHWWSEALLDRGIATITFDGPGLGETFHRLSTVAEPRPVGPAILNAIEAQPELDPNAVAFFGQSLGGYMAIQMASHDRRVRAVAAVSPPYSADIYWDVTLSSMRRELANLYRISEQELGEAIPKMTLAHVLPDLRCPMMISGGGHDLITPGTEAWRIFEGSRCERELVFYPRGAHDCFNVLADLRPRMVAWLARQLERHHGPLQPGRPRIESEPEAHWQAAEAVDPEFADAMLGDAPRREWQHRETESLPAHWRWRRGPVSCERLEVVHRLAGGLAAATLNGAAGR